MPTLNSNGKVINFLYIFFFSSMQHLHWLALRFCCCFLLSNGQWGQTGESEVEKGKRKAICARAAAGTARHQLRQKKDLFSLCFKRIDAWKRGPFCPTLTLLLLEVIINKRFNYFILMTNSINYSLSWLYLCLKLNLWVCGKPQPVFRHVHRCPHPTH